MAESNEGWGIAAENEDGFAATWDKYLNLPEAGENEVLDAFCAAKHITIPALLRVGAKLKDASTLAYAYPEGIKYRDMMTGKMWSAFGSEYPHMKMVRAGTEPTDDCIVVEGETDGARVSDEYNLDTFILPAGARRWTKNYAAQVLPYKRVIVGTDKDEAGEDGAKKIMSSVPNAVRFTPEDGDWCDVDTLPDIESLGLPDESMGLLVKAGDMWGMEVPEVASWFEHALLPIGGLAILHGWAKSLKTWQTLDMMAALAQGQDWGGFEPTEEPCKVGIIQFELPWPYYYERMQMLKAVSREPLLFDENVHTWTPGRRPELVAGNKESEDRILRELVDHDINVVLFDPIRRATGAIDFNSEQEVRNVLAFFERMQNEGLTVVATHHDNKESGRSRGGSTLGMTGSGAFAGDPDTIISVELPKDEDPNTSLKRNLNFTIRNGPPIGPRGMVLQEDGQILYTTEPWAYTDDGADDAADTTDAPAI
jgi:5S rRNA maturation endonuclease (ribonuclease M5)